MKFTISTQEFNYLISKILNVVPLKPTMPILSNFLLNASDDEIILTATDLTVGIRCNTEADIKEEGSTTLNAKFLTQLLRELTVPQIEFSTDSNQVTTIKAGTSRFKIHGMSHSEFPDLPDLAHAFNFKIKQKELKALIANTSFAVSKEDTRYVLTGVLMEIGNGKISMLGTDGKRLAKTQTPLEAIEVSEQYSCVVPLKAIDEIAKILLDEDEATISIMPDKIAVEANQMLLVTKLLSGDYPDVGRVIPEKINVSVVLHRDELISLLRQISLFMKDQHHSVRFCFENHELKLSANSMEIGEGFVCMPIHYNADSIEMAFSPTFFIDILRHCKEETVTMGLVDPYNPVIIVDGDQPIDISSASPLFILMPMRLSED